MTVEGSAPTTADSAASGAEQGASDDVNSPESTPGKEKVQYDFRGTKHKVEFDGVQDEVDYDDLIREYQKGRTADERLKKVSTVQRQITEFFSGLKSGDKAVFEELRETVPKEKLQEWAEEFLLEQYEEEDLPEHEKEARRTRRENEDLKKKLDGLESARKRQEWASEVKKAGEELQSDLDTFFEETGVEKNPYYTYRLIEFLLAEEETAEKQGRKPDVKKAYNRAVKTFELDGMRYMNGRTPSDFIKKAPPAFIKALRQHFIDEAQGVRRYDPSKEEGEGSSSPGSSEPRTAKKKLGIDEWFDTLPKRLRR